MCSDSASQSNAYLYLRSETGFERVARSCFKTSHTLNKCLSSSSSSDIKLTDFQFSSIKIMCNTSHIFTAMCNFPCDGQRPMFTRKGIELPPQWRVGVYGSTAVAGGMVFPKFGGSTATLVGRVCDLLVDSFLLLMSYQILWQFTSSHWRTGVWIIRTIRYCMVTLWLSIVLWHSPNPCRVVVLVIPYIEMLCWLQRLLNSPLSIMGMGLKRNCNSVWILLLWTL